MKLSSVKLENFRGASHLEVELNPTVTVMVGRNGVGKSSVLDALAIMLARFQAVWDDDKTRYQYKSGFFKKSDIKYGKDDYSISVGLRLEDAIGETFPLTIDLKSSDGHFLRGTSSFDEMRHIVVNRTLLAGKDDLLVYYRQDRGFEDKPTGIQRLEPASSLFGSLKAISQLEIWLDRRDAEEARHVRDVDPDYRDPQLQAVRALLREVDEFQGVGFSSSGEVEGIFFIKEDGAKIPVSSLSTGERSFIILLADLARRLQLTKPELELDQIPAIVLIDEIELNLHPSWQSKIIPTLTRVFKSCQFVITTHSPQVISSVEREQVRTLNKTTEGIKVEIPIRTKGQTSNYILEGIFDAHERYPEIDRLFSAFNDAVDDENYAEATKALQLILGEMENEPTELALLRKRLKRIEPQL